MRFAPRLCLLLVLCLLGAAPVPTAAAQQATPEAATGRTPKAEATADRHMIVAANPHASEAGLAMLRAGGSAADAAIAALAVLNVVEPQSSGIGGGAFAVLHGPEGLTTLDARETAPAAAGPDFFMEGGHPLSWWDARVSGRSTGAPGLVALMGELHARHGRLDWAALFDPAIRLAREGFAVSPRLSGLLATYEDFLADKDAAAVFLPGGTPLSEGETLRQPDLAATLAQIAREGPSAFYRGPVPEAIAAAVAAPPRPGFLTAADVADYRVIERPAVCGVYRGHRVCGMGPPSSGATTVGQILGILDRFPPPEARDEPRFAHLFAWASRLAYADRARYLGDPDAVAVPVAGLLDAEYLAARALRIDLARAGGIESPGVPPGALPRGRDASRDAPGTTHLSVIDGDGLAISLTASIESAFGSGRMAAGFLLNNQLTDFARAPRDAGGHLRANAPGPGKRPRSSMAPTIVYRPGGTAPAILAGSPGGSRIPEYVAGALVAMIDLGAGPGRAAAGFHLSERNRGTTVLEADATPGALAEALAALGHEVVREAMTSGLHLLAIGPEGTLRGGADPRREGVGLGD